MATENGNVASSIEMVAYQRATDSIFIQSSIYNGAVSTNHRSIMVAFQPMKATHSISIPNAVEVLATRRGLAGVGPRARMYLIRLAIFHVDADAITASSQLSRKGPSLATCDLATERSSAPAKFISYRSQRPRHGCTSDSIEAMAPVHTRHAAIHALLDSNHLRRRQHPSSMNRSMLEMLPPTTNATRISIRNDTGGSTITNDVAPLSAPFCNPVACQLLSVVAVVGVVAILLAMVWQVYQRHLFKRERLRFQERETELRTAMEYIESSRSLHSNRSGTTSDQSWVASERSWVPPATARPRDDTAMLEP